MDRAGDLASPEAGSEFESFGCGNGEHGVREERFHSIEYRFAEAGGHVADHAGDRPAYTVVLVAVVSYSFFHCLGGCGVGTADGDVFVDFFARD